MWNYKVSGYLVMIYENKKNNNNNKNERVLVTMIHIHSRFSEHKCSKIKWKYIDSLGRTNK